MYFYSTVTNTTALSANAMFSDLTSCWSLAWHCCAPESNFSFLSLQVNIVISQQGASLTSCAKGTFP